ncbi:MAG: 50S ribosomal protein L21 [Candidatus Pacebacteria bacterium]|nr:50S ribosomal protein L21 [Candidatus Paceibacterota bacterium]
MLAVIKTGGKQYTVEPGKKLKIEKLEAEVGKEVIFDQVLLLDNGKKLEIGEPLVEGAKVVGKVIQQGKAKKVIALRYKAKKRVSVKKGHRQKFTEVEITKI